MSLHYLVQIKDPKNHYVQVTMEFERADKGTLSIFLPSWSPGSYLMREYSRHIRNIKAVQENGEDLFCSQIDKGTWEINFKKSDTKKNGRKISVHYEVYCHELTVRTSHIDESHAFLHGPSYLMGLVDSKMKDITIEFRFPALWSKLATGLKDISQKREIFLYSAKDYDELLDTPVEIGCHESDGFLVDGKPHHLNFYGPLWPHGQNLKEDIKTIVETVSNVFGDTPYEQYVFITHFAPNLYGGLEHHNSTALQFDGTTLANRDSYLNWLELVSHEYFHTWNVKRIRPIELGPFDYRNENYTQMHWLTEGLTSFMDRLLVLRSGLMTLDEYLKKMRDDLNKLLDNPGRKFHSLEQSSFNAWIKLYRADENSRNSSVSYYLKGGIVFFCLHCLFVNKGKKIDDLLSLLWSRYKADPENGMTDSEVYKMIESIAGKDVLSEFQTMVTTTEEIDFEKYLKLLSIEGKWKNDKTPYLGIVTQSEGDNIIVTSVALDGPAYAAGINACDELLAINNVRVTSKMFTEFSKNLQINKNYNLLISRNGNLVELNLLVGQTPKTLESLSTINKTETEKYLN